MIQPSSRAVTYRGTAAPLSVFADASRSSAAQTSLTLRQPPLPKLGGLPAEAHAAPRYDAARVLTGLLRKWNSRALDGPEASARINVATDFTGLDQALGELHVGDGTIGPLTCTHDGLVLFGVDDNRLISAIANPDGSLSTGDTLTLPWSTRLAPLVATEGKTLVVGDNELAFVSSAADGKLATIGETLPFTGTASGALVNRDGNVVLAAGSALHSYHLTPGGILEEKHSVPVESGWVFDRPPFETDDGIIVATLKCEKSPSQQRLCAFVADADGILKQVASRDLGVIDTLSRTNVQNRFVVSSGTKLTAFQVETNGFVATGTCVLRRSLPQPPVITKTGCVAGFTDDSTFTIRLRGDGSFGEPTYDLGWTETRPVVTRDDIVVGIRARFLVAQRIEADGKMPIVASFGDTYWLRHQFAMTPQGHVVAAHSGCIRVIGAKS